MTSYPTPQHPPSAYQPPPSNGIGITGFVVSLSGLLLCAGFLCPIGLLLSLIGLGKEPRGFAIAGTIIGLLGSLIALFIVLAIAGVISTGGSMFNFFSSQWQTQMTMDSASWEIDRHYTNNNNTLPDQATGTGIIANNGYYDDWGMLLEYRPVTGSTSDYEIVSAGPDMQFGTNDDIFSPYTAGFSFGSSATVAPNNPFGDTGPDQAQIDYSFNQAVKRIQTASPTGLVPPDTAAGSLLIQGTNDPWYNPFQYEYRPADGSFFRLKSAGPDGQWQTEDDIDKSFFFEPGGGG